MSKRCNACNIEYTDDKSFCTSCGGALVDTPVVSNPEVPATEVPTSHTANQADTLKNVVKGEVMDKIKSMGKDALIPFAAGAAVVIVIILLVTLVTSIPLGAKGVAQSYISGVKKQDAGKIVKLYSKEFKDAVEEDCENSYMCSDDIKEDWKETFEAFDDADIEITKVKLTGVYEKYSEDELDDFINDYEDFSDELDGDDIKEVRRYFYYYETKDDDKNIDKAYSSVTIYKDKKGWHLYDLN